MILWWVALLMKFYCCLNGAAAETMGLERIENCRTKCSQGLHCKTKPDFFFHPSCQKPTGGLKASSMFHSSSLSTVLRCEGRQRCSLHLRIRTVLQLTESIHGVSICTETPGMMSQCRIVIFTKASRERMWGQQVEVENDCTELSPSQQVQIIVKSFPSYCGIKWTGAYVAPGCTNEDLKRHVPECITGRLSYDVYPQRKELSVTVTDMLQDYGYHLRLCLKDFICVGTGVNVLLKREEPMKKATLPYSRPLPCLCLEGWSDMMDAPRVRVCPFKDRLEELWLGITFDQLEETLAWEPACPVAAVVTLCQKRENGVCVDLPHSSHNVSREKVTFTKVDPHPQLCMKFTAGNQSWTRCPFTDGRCQAWEVAVTRPQGREEVKMLSHVTANFSVGLCVRSAASPVCKTDQTHTVHVQKQKSIALNLSGEQCKFNSCIQMKRLDVKYAATIMHCFDRCDHSSLLVPVHKQPTWDLTWLVVPAGVCLFGIIIVTLVLHIMLTVYRRRKQKTNQGICTSEKQTDCALDCVVPTLQTTMEVLIPDSPQCGNTEKANLLSN